MKSDVDVNEVKQRLATIIADKGLQGKIEGQQQQIRQLEQQVQGLNARLNVAPVSSTGELRKERNVVVDNIEELENKKLAAVRAITEKSQLVRRYIVRNMTEAEVLSILGQPRARSVFSSWNYGDLWVCFHSGLVDKFGDNELCR